MGELYPTIDMLRSHTSLNIAVKNNKTLQVKTLSSKEGKKVWQVFFSGEKGLLSAVIKCGCLPHSSVEFELYKGRLEGFAEFLPTTYGQWQQDEYYCIAMEHVDILPQYTSFKMQKGIIELVAKLHGQFFKCKENIQGVPFWRKFTPHNLDHYFTDLEQKVEDQNYEFSDSYKGLLKKGIMVLPQLLEQTQGFPHTLIHGDVHRINTGVNLSKELVFIDWENAQIAPATFDIVWLMERSLASQPHWIERAEDLREWGILTYLELIERYGMPRGREDFLREYKVAYIYLVLTSLIWNYGRESRRSTLLDYHLRTFSRWSEELNLL